MFPKISIIVPTLNQARFIEETIQSVLTQKYPNLEVIVIDGGSTDNTIEILKKYTGSLTWISEPDKGQVDAINKGLKLVTGEVVAYLNSDDVYTP
ncbi:MAG: glycosyltransferase, partial [Anaerolineaceae bacterium]